jgi:hypothetical protein
MFPAIEMRLFSVPTARLDYDIIISEIGREAVPPERAVKPIDSLPRTLGRGERLDLDSSFTRHPMSEVSDVPQYSASARIMSPICPNCNEPMKRTDPARDVFGCSLCNGFIQFLHLNNSNSDLSLPWSKYLEVDDIPAGTNDSSEQR